jgi:mannosyltransferase
VLAGLVLLGAVLRFASLDLQSYRYDEAVTVGRVLHPNLLDTLSAVPRSESTPPLYYALAWLWSRAFGTGEVGLRSLSALAGTASIAVVYLAARALPLRARPALIAAAIVAVNPVLVWFSQDARAYALAFLLTSLSFLFFARARRGGKSRDPAEQRRRGTDLAWWAVFSSLALATHYFAGFVVLPEALLLLTCRFVSHSATNRQLGGRAEGFRRAGSRRTWVAIGVVAATGLLLLPIGLRQAENAHAGWIGEQPLGERLERAAAKLVGDDNGDEHGKRRPGPIPLGVPLALALAALALLLWRGDPTERQGAKIAAIVGGAGVALPLALGALGADYLDGRNLIPVFAPLIVLLGAGFGVRRAGRTGLTLAAAFCLCALAFTIEIDRLPRLQREDLRNAAQQIEPLRPGVAVVTIRYTANQPLRYYLGARFAEGTLPPLREIDLVGSASAERHAAHLLPASFHRIESKPVSYDFTLARYRAARPVSVPLPSLERGALVGGGARASVLVAP